jgi:hypothetical protein
MTIHNVPTWAAKMNRRINVRVEHDGALVNRSSRLRHFDAVGCDGGAWLKEDRG